MAGVDGAGIELLAAKQIATLSRNKARALLYSNVLGKACYQLDRAAAEKHLVELKRFGLLDAGLAFASEVRPVDSTQNLGAKEWKLFQVEIGCTPLVISCLACAKQLDCIRQELDIKIDVSRSEREKQVQASAGDVVELLVKFRAAVDYPGESPSGNTALHIAARCGAPHLVSTLLRIGADCAARNKDGLSAEALARRSSNTTCEQILQVTAMACMQSTEALVEELEDDDDSEPAEEPSQMSKGVQQQGRSGGGKSAAESQPAKRGKEDKVDVGRDRSDGARRGYQPRHHDSHLQHGASESSEGDEGLDEDQEGHGPDDFSLKIIEVDAQMRVDFVKLHQQKALCAQELTAITAELAGQRREVEQAQRRAAQLKSQAERLRNQEIKVRAGEMRAILEMRQEVEASQWWEKQATAQARANWELERSHTQMREEHKQTIAALQKELRAEKRKIQGLDHFWDQLYEAQAANEILDRHSSERRLEELVAAIARDTSPMAALPRLIVGDPGDARAPLPPVDILVKALQMHRKAYEAQQNHDARFDELLDQYNKSLLEKDDEFHGLVEQFALHYAPHAGGSEVDRWLGLAQAASNARRTLEAMSRPVGTRSSSANA